MSEESWDPAANLLRNARDQVDQARTTGETTRPDAGTEPPSGVADGRDGRIHVEIDRAGHISELRMDPRVMALPTDELAAVITETVNAAVDDLKASMTESVPAAPSLDALGRMLDQVSSDSRRAIDRATDGVRRSMSAIQRISELHRGKEG